MNLYTPETMRAVDRKAVELGYPSLLLMDTAGRVVARTFLQNWAQKAVVLCGKGNNGGDGLVAARWLKVWGHPVAVFAAAGQQGDALLARQALEAHGIEIKPLEAWQPEANTVLVDALFGTGLARPLEGFYANLVEQVNASGLYVLAVDVPSGLPYSSHIQATQTVALAGLKHEHVFYPARQSCGSIYLNTIGMPAQALNSSNLPELLTPEAMATLLPRRRGNAHKGSVGRVLVAGGFKNYTGAPTLAALAAYRAGSGLVTVAYPQDCPVEPPLEAVRLPISNWDSQFLTAAKADAIAVGMGAGDFGPLAAKATLERRLPTVLDADALHPEVLEAYQKASIPVVITPHPGEASRLLGTSSESIAQDPLSAAQALSQRYPGFTVVLKGGPTVLAEQQKVAVNTTGNPGMATGGMGDVLSGIIAALLAAGLPSWKAACLGVYWHGLAGDLVGKTGLLAHELAHMLPQARQALQGGQVRGFWQAQTPRWGIER